MDKQSLISPKVANEIKNTFRSRINALDEYLLEDIIDALMDRRKTKNRYIMDVVELVLEERRERRRK